MKTETELRGGGPCTLEEFAERYGLVMAVSERSLAEHSVHVRFTAHFKCVEVKTDGHMLAGYFGNGPTPEIAIQDYGRKIAGRRLVFNAYTPDRKEFDAPNEWKEKE